MVPKAGESSGTAEPEWPKNLDTDAWKARGWQPTPFRQFIVKLHSRCNLACQYCYVYEHADQTWRDRPLRMSAGLVSVVASRIAEHARAHDLADVRVIFHGGEPLLAGTDVVVDAFRKIRSAVEAGIRVEGWIQTNGTLLTEASLGALEALGIQVGVSMDGDVDTHDLGRRHANGQGSHAEVARGLRLLMRRPGIYSGVLCVVDLRADPVATYDALLSFQPPTIDFLLPHANWMSPPPQADRTVGTRASYAEWLIAVFDRWYDSAIRETHIRIFEEIINLLLGGKSATEVVGLTPTSLIVIETDGSIEQSDALKSTYHGAARTGLHIVRDSFDTALQLPEIAARQLGLGALSDECLACEIRRICGGGLYAHRYHRKTGFRNRSVYCDDLYALIMHIRKRIAVDLSSIKLR
jgi:uncharacterized protein